MEDDAEKQHIFDLFQRWVALKSRPCLIVYTERGKKKNDNVEALEAFVLTPFSFSLFFTLVCTFPERDSHERARFISPKASTVALLYLWGFCIDFKSYEKGRAKLEERESYTMYLGTQKHLQADWNVKWHLMENETLAFSAHSSDNLSMSIRQKSAEIKCL